MTDAALIFKGEFVHQLDDKGRFKLPVKMQEAFEDEFGLQCVMMKMPERCLGLYPARVWQQEFGDYLSGSGKLMPGDMSYFKLSRWVASRSEALKIGVQGRVATPEGFRSFIGVEPGGNVVIVGAGERIEIWSEELWREESGSAEEGFADLLQQASREVFSRKFAGADNPEK